MRQSTGWDMRLKGGRPSISTYPFVAHRLMMHARNVTLSQLFHIDQAILPMHDSPAVCYWCAWSLGLTPPPGLFRGRDPGCEIFPDFSKFFETGIQHVDNFTLTTQT